MSYSAGSLNKYRDAGWKIMLFSWVTGNENWSLSARHERSYSWVNYQHPDPDVLIKAFVEDHPLPTSSGEVMDKPKEEK